MKIDKLLTQKDQKDLLAKMWIEYEWADNYTRDWKSKVMNYKEDYLIPEPNEDKVKVKKVLNLMKMKRSIFKTDDEEVTAVSDNGQIWEEVAWNFNKVVKYNYKSMGLRIKKGKAQDDDTMYWIWCLTVDSWNDYKQEPIVNYIDSRLTFPDPSNSEWNEMRFFWTLLKKTIYELESDEAYDKERVQKVRMERNEELDKIDRANWNNEWDIWDDLVSIYNHITIFKKEWSDEYMKVLTTWNASRTILLRYVEMQPLTENEKADPSTITLWVTLYRGIPIPWQYQWANAIDEVWPYQDLENLITNLQIQQALRNVVWGKTILDAELWVNEWDYANLNPWEVIIANRQMWSQTTVSNGIFREPPEISSPVVETTLARLDRLSQEATLQNSLTQGQSLSWSQTKSEVQTIQQNANTILMWIASEYMWSSINLWTDIYRSYLSNMSPQRTKKITLKLDNGKSDSYWFKKNEFITKGELYIDIISKAQEDIQNKKDFAVMLSLDASISAMYPVWSTELKIWKRTLLNKSWIKWLDWDVINPLTPDERKAYGQLQVLNSDIALKEEPLLTEDHNIFINIYKTWIPTKARDNAIALRERLLEKTPKEAPTEETWKGWGGWIGASLIASANAQDSGNANLWDIKV